MNALIDFCTLHPGADSALRCAFENPCQTLVAHTLDDVRPLLAQVEALSRQGFWCVGYVRFEAAPAFDTALEVYPADGPLAYFGVYENANPWPEATMTQAAKAQWQDSITRSRFDTQMRQIHHAISAGEIYQVNYTAPLSGTLQGKPLDLFLAMQRAQPQGYAACLDCGTEQVLSASPELFFDWNKDQLLVRPMKGTAPRGNDAQSDQDQASKLQNSAKERAENVMIVDLIRNDLSRVAEPFSVRVPELFKVQTLPTVLQMVSDVQATSRKGTTLVDIFTALFPCGSITGAPKVRAMKMIKSLETGPRGLYCGAIGVVRPGGHATFNVAIRTVTVQGKNLRCGIGSGITADATAADEWQEWRHKRAFLERASATFELLETLRLQDGQWHEEALHLTRLARASAHFGFIFEHTQVTHKLQTLARTHAQGLWRVRLLLDRQGTSVLQASAQDANPTQVTVQLATRAFEAADSEFVRFKTTHRAHYEAMAPSTPGVFDTLLWNRQGEFTEFTRGNVAFLLDGRWITPPLRCGLLDGVGRAHYLQAQQLHEGVVTLQDLPRVQAMAFINSLRGWLSAIWVPHDPYSATAATATLGVMQV